MLRDFVFNLCRIFSSSIAPSPFQTFPKSQHRSFATQNSLPASAQKVAAQVKRACAGDYKKLCPQYKVGSPQLRACMEAKQNSLSMGCVSALIDSGEASRSARR